MFFINEPEPSLIVNIVVYQKENLIRKFKNDRVIKLMLQNRSISTNRRNAFQRLSSYL